ncbi:MAG: hypothetical protein V2J08_01485 [Desulfotignum sp.]|jgi:hypothetical protein|nr:hypothetical protein [Desulfotignum sp.]
MITPTAAFVQWFDNIPIELRKYLAHIFRVCTTEDTSQMAALPDQSLTGFRAWVVKLDFPLRMAAKMFYIRAVFDMVILHRHEITDDKGAFGLLSEKSNIVRLSAKQWEAVIHSWKALRQAQLSDTYVHSWTSWMIKQQKESR